MAAWYFSIAFSANFSLRCSWGDMTRGSSTRTITCGRGAGTAASKVTGFFSQHLSQHLHSLLSAAVFALQHLSQHLHSLSEHLHSFSWQTATTSAFGLQHLSQHSQSFSQHLPGHDLASASLFTIMRGVTSSSTCWVSVL